MILVEGDTACDTDFAMYYTLYHIFQQKGIILYYMNCFLIHITKLPSAFVLFQSNKITAQLFIRSTWVTLQSVVLKIFCLLLYLFECFVFFIVAFSVPKNMQT